MFGLAHRAVLLAPAEDAFDHRSTRLRHAIAFVPRGASVDGAPTTLAGCRDAAARLLGFGLEHDLRSAALGSAVGERDHARHRQPMAVLHGGVAHVTELCFPPGGLAVESAVGIASLQHGSRTGRARTLMAIPGFFHGTGMPDPGWWEAFWPDPAG